MPRRSASSNNTLSPADANTPGVAFPRSNSPSNGIANLFSKPTKWFTRSASASKYPTGSTEPRASSSSTRTYKISRPTDPRPIVDSYGANGIATNGIGARSVMDLSTRAGPSFDFSDGFMPSTPTSPSTPEASSAGLGDLRSISKKSWSRSADDLNKVSPLRLQTSPSFQQKIKNYRSRSGSTASVASPTSPHGAFSPSSGDMKPFPPLKGGKESPSLPPMPLSSSPPQMQNNYYFPPSPTISVSGPGVEDTIPEHPSPTLAKLDNLPPGQQVHTRSHSFTPKLPSKLAPNNLRSPPPPSPMKRKGSAGGDTLEPSIKEFTSPVKRKGSGGGDAFESGVRNFPFHLGLMASGGNSNRTPPPEPPHSPHSPRAGGTGLLAPPHELHNSPANEAPDRASQIIYHSGFLNRLQGNVSQQSLSKGWKPFKTELKGSKLYFYKPPSNDRANGMRDLFPAEVVLDEEDEDAAADEKKDDAAADSRGGTFGRKKRAYWGRRTHPSLVKDGEEVTGGTFEALVHETVFATTFLQDQSADEVAIAEGKKRWTEFASATILCLPVLVGKSKFETEFLRCCDNLVTGCQEDQREREKGRVTWLTSEYLRCHETPADVPAWDQWKQDILPDVTFHQADVVGLPSSISTQAVHQLSPRLSTPGSIALSSPNPQISYSKADESSSKHASMLELFKATGIQSSPSSTSAWVNALDQEGLSRDVLLHIDPQLLAKSLALFHRAALLTAPTNISAKHLLSSDVANTEPLAAFFGSDNTPHWLTKLLLVQILGMDTSIGYAAHHKTDSNQMAGTAPTTSRTHSRSEVISVWAKVGEHCRQAGDESSFRAIMAALTCPPVARLEKVWKRVDSPAMSIVESWVHEAGDVHQQARCTPWGGDTRSKILRDLEKCGIDEDWRVSKMVDIRTRFDAFRSAFLLCPRKGSLAAECEDAGVKKLLGYWSDMNQDGGGDVATRFQSVEQFMSLSVAAEPRRKGLFEPYHWTRPNSSNQPPHSSLLPLLFPEPLPTLSIVDRARLVRGRVDSDQLDIQTLKNVNGHLRPQKQPAPQPRGPPEGLTSRNMGGTVIPLFNGDLLVAVQSSTDSDSRPGSRSISRPPSGSRPPSSIASISEHGVMEKGPMSRSPSIRVKPGASQGLDRKSSMARRNSLPSLSNKQNFVTTDPSSKPPLRVTVQSGSLNQLVDVLVHGIQSHSVSVADDNGEMTLGKGMTRDLWLDRTEFSRIWWNVFRSFVTPLVLFELLRKLYINAQPKAEPITIVDYLTAARSRSEVIDTIKEWVAVGGGAQDMLDDTSLLHAFGDFLSSTADSDVTKSPSFEDPVVQKAWYSLSELRSSMKDLVKRSIMRPPAATQPMSKPLVVVNEPRGKHVSSREPPNIDGIEPEEFVDNLDGMAYAAFSNVTQEDLFVTADLLEVQSADRTGWFPPRDISYTEDSVEIQTIYSTVQDVEPSPMISELGQDSLYRLLPPGIRSCMRAHTVLRKWLISKIVTPKLGHRQRQNRMEVLLRALEIARLRSAEAATPESIVEKPCVRSFVETVLTSAIVSAESRMHARTWQAVALARNTHADALTNLLFRPSVQPTSSREALTVDLGWLVERILDVISMPDILNPSPDGQSLVNFDKRRHLCNLITTAPSLLVSRRQMSQSDLSRRGFERLNSIEREVYPLQFDLRGIREEANREGQAMPTGNAGSARKVSRPFQRTIALQLEKNRRDRNLRMRLQKEKVLEQTRNERRDDLLNKAMRPRTAANKQHRNKKSMSAFLQFMRPISSAFSSDTLQSAGLKRSAAELDYPVSGKPAMVVSLIEARVAPYINRERSFTFVLDTEDGGHYLLQAMTRKDLNKWMDTIQRVANLAAKRRLTYIGNSPQPQLEDHIPTRPVSASKDPVAVFGVELQYLLTREARGHQPSPGAIPSVLEDCLSEIEAHGLSEVGIYRIAGAVSEINGLKDAFNRGEHPITSRNDIHAICDLVKSWFRVLPEPVFPSNYYRDAIEAMKIEDLDERLRVTRKVVQSLPQTNFDLVKRVAEHLDKVADYEEHNHMTLDSLSIVFSPNLLRAPHDDITVILANMGFTHKIVKTLVGHFHYIFEENDPDAELDADVDEEDELDSPHLEQEDEEESSAHFLTSS